MVLEELLSDKWIIECHEAWVKIAITIHLAKLLAKENQELTVIDNPGILHRAAYYLPENIVLTTQPAQGGKHAVIIDPHTIPHPYNLPPNTVVLATPGTIRRKPRDWLKARIKRVTNNEYIIEGDINERILLGRNLEIKPVESPAGIKGEALEILRNAVIDYGEITVKDAVIILAHELGIGKAEARKIIIDLARKRYVRIEHGHVFPL